MFFYLLYFFQYFIINYAFDMTNKIKNSIRNISLKKKKKLT